MLRSNTKILHCEHFNQANTPYHVTQEQEISTYDYKTNFEELLSTPIYRSKITWGSVVPYQPYFQVTEAPKNKFPPTKQEVLSNSETLVSAESQKEYGATPKLVSSDKHFSLKTPPTSSLPAKTDIVYLPPFLSQTFQSQHIQNAENIGKEEYIEYIKDYGSSSFGLKNPSVIAPEQTKVDTGNHDPKKHLEEPQEKIEEVVKIDQTIRVPKLADLTPVQIDDENPSVMKPVHEGSSPVKLIFTGETYVPEIAPKY